jgi:vacuolar-type H+-ATPase subunit I/STV1
MTIYNIHSEIEFSYPDTSGLDISLAQMIKLDAAARYAFGITSFLPGVQTKWEKLYKTASQGRANIRSQTETVIIHLTSSLEQLNKLRNEYAELTDSEEQDDNLHLRELALSAAEKKYKDYLSQLQKQMSELQGLTLNTEQLIAYTPDLKADAQGFDDEITAIDTRMATLETERKTLTDGMLPLEKTGFTDIAKDTLLSLESVNNLGVSPPEAELVKLAIAHMQKVLEGIGRNLNYLEMYKERERVITKIKVETEARDRVEAKQTEAGHKIVLVDSVLNLFTEYTSVTQELVKVMHSVEQFDRLVSNENADHDDKESRFVNTAQSLISYLETVR